MAFVQPLLDDALQLTEQMQLRLAIGVAPFGEQQMRRELVDDLRRAHSPVCTRLRSTVSPMIPELRVSRGAHQIRRQFEHRVLVELGGQPLFRQLDAIAFHTREADFERIAVGPNRLDLRRSRAAAAAARPPAWH